jgi:hypothetical protein
MHQWGDEDVDWKGIDDAGRYIAKNLLWWRVDVRDWKEKFGTIRVYCSLGIGWWPQLTHPGHVYNRWPRWLDFIAYGGYNRWNPLYWALRGINVVAVPLHVWVYKRYYRKACEKWPHLKQEILRCADFHELLGAKVTYQTIWWPEFDKEPTKPAWWPEELPKDARMLGELDP